MCLCPVMITFTVCGALSADNPSLRSLLISSSSGTPSSRLQPWAITSSDCLAILGGPRHRVPRALASSALHASRVATHFGSRRYFLPSILRGCCNLFWCVCLGSRPRTRSVFIPGPSARVDNFDKVWEDVVTALGIWIQTCGRLIVRPSLD